ncbi:MAG: thiolase family protein [Acidimicrobiales bacterium]
MRGVFIADAVRTPIGKLGGVLAGVRPDDLAAHALRAILDRNPSLDPGRVDDVFWGASNQAGEDNRNLARMAVLLAGMPVSVPGATINRLCASGLSAVVSAAHEVAVGEADICIAGGTESMTRAPFVMPRAEEAYPRRAEIYDTRIGWRMVNSKMTQMYPPISLGETAEEVAQRYGISREAQDQFALRSHQRAAEAWASGRFASEVVPVASGEISVERDESIREDTSLEALARLKPVFRAGGTVTAGNSSPMNDGAAAVLIMSETVANELSIEPLARYVAAASAGVHPDIMGMGPVPSTKKALHIAGWDISDLELVELNEAFASQSVAVIDELNLEPDMVNVNGGAIAIGHPLGCSGARITTTLVHEMSRRGARRGLATMCIGVGQGVSVLWEGS